MRKLRRVVTRTVANGCDWGSVVARDSVILFTVVCARGGCLCISLLAFVQRP